MLLTWMFPPLLCYPFENVLITDTWVHWNFLVLHCACMIRHSIQLSSDIKWHGILWHNLVLMGTLHTVYVQTKEIVGIVVFDMIAIRYGDVLTLYNCISGGCNFTIICTFMYNWYSWQDGVCVDGFYVLCWCQKWALSVVDNRGVGSIFNSLYLLYISKGTCIYFLCHTTAEKSIFDLLKW